ncbi:hypothetical protein [Rhizohabitans arisaemae]|uniref:hypothetical protein n=1 Tax=Rhizohabitans arisaemae TaxID=2720610 RepID=UPI0024B102FF|nr:hypothetical protein [Rhizohabitans arisaemae]
MEGAKAMGSRMTRLARRAVGFLLTAAVCELLICVGALLLLLGFQRELKAQRASLYDGLGDDGWLDETVNTLPSLIWVLFAVGLIRLALAASAGRGGTPGVRVFSVLVLAPYTLFYVFLGLLGTDYADKLRPSLWWDLVLVLAGAALLCHLVGTGLLLFTGPNRPKIGDTRRGRERLRSRWAVACLLAASLCGLAVAASSLVFLPSVWRRLADHRSGLLVDSFADNTLDALQGQLWVYAAAGVIALALAALVWRRGGTPRVRTLVALAVAPYATLLLFGPSASLSLWPGYGLWVEHVGWYVDFPWWMSITAALCYLAGTALLVFTKAVRRGELAHAADPGPQH